MINPDRALRIAIAQSSSVAGEVVANAQAAARTIAKAGDRGAELVVFPELSLTGYEPDAIRRSDETWLHTDDARLDPVRRACADARVTAVLGAPLRTAGAPAQAPLIAALIFSPGGELRTSAKQHLHGSESELFAAGEPAAPFSVAGWQISVAICFDAAHPRHAEAAALAGADLYLVSALYDVGEERRADLTLGARAMDHRMFTALANYAGVTGGHRSCGQSGVWLPTGAVLCRASSAEETLLVANLDPAELRRYRTPA